MSGAPDLTMRERIAEAHRRESAAHQLRSTGEPPQEYATCWCWQIFKSRAEWLEHQQLMAATEVALLLTSQGTSLVSDAAVKAALAEEEAHWGHESGYGYGYRCVNTVGCTWRGEDMDDWREHRMTAILTAAIAAIKEGKA